MNNELNFVNCTPHEIKLNDGTIYPPSGVLTRVSVVYTEFDENNIC